MRAVPGVQQAEVALRLPYERALNNGFRFVGGPSAGQIINVTYVTPEYFEALRIPVVRGRVLTASDAQGRAAVIVVNQSFVRRHSPDQDPIGRQIQTSGIARTIVGIVGDVQQKVTFGSYGPVAPTPAAYVPVTQVSNGFLTMVHTWFSPSWIVRLAGPQQGVVAQMQNAVGSVDPQLPFTTFRTLDDVRGEAVAAPRAQAWLLGTLASLALLLAAGWVFRPGGELVPGRPRRLGLPHAPGPASRPAVVPAAGPACAAPAIGT